MKEKVLNFIMFQIGWWASVLGAGADNYWIGPVTITAMVTFHLYLSDNWRRDLLTVLMVGVVGFITDSLQIGTSVFTPEPIEPTSWICPPWLLFMWFGFAITLHSSLGWLKNSLALSSFFALIGGPVTYYSGEKFGALLFNENLVFAFTTMAIAWAVAMPVLLYIARRLEAIFDRADYPTE